MRVRVCPAGFGCSQSSTRNCPSRANTLTWVRTNFETKIGGPLAGALWAAAAAKAS